MRPQGVVTKLRPLEYESSRKRATTRSLDINRKGNLRSLASDPEQFLLGNLDSVQQAKRERGSWEGGFGTDNHL